MAKVTLYSSQVEIAYEDVVKLRNAGLLNLGISNDLAAAVVSKGFGPKNKGVYWSFRVFNWLAMLTLGYTIYGSFVADWWWFIVGLFCAYCISAANRQGNAESVLVEALRDQEFYNRILIIKGWFYEIEEETLYALIEHAIDDPSNFRWN